MPWIAPVCERTKEVISLLGGGNALRALHHIVSEKAHVILGVHEVERFNIMLVTYVDHMQFIAIFCFFISDFVIKKVAALVIHTADRANPKKKRAGG